MNNTFLSPDEIIAAKFVLKKVLPAFGLAPDIIKTLFFASIIAKCKLVLKPRIASIARSAGFSTANKVSD